METVETYVLPNLPEQRKENAKRSTMQIVIRFANDAEMDPSKVKILVFNAKKLRKGPYCAAGGPHRQVEPLSSHSYQRKYLGLDESLLARRSKRAVVGVFILFTALQTKFGPTQDVEVFAEQAVSGARSPEAPTVDIVDNAITYIAIEQDKLENEAQDISGSINSNHTALKNRPA